MSDSRSGWPIVLVAAVIAAGAIGYFWRDMQKSVPQAVITVEPEPELSAPPVDEPRHPIAPLDKPAGRSLVPLPPLSDSDSYFALELVDVFGDNLEVLLDNEALIEKFVATVDNLTRTNMAERIRPVSRMTDNFDAGGDGSDESLTLQAANFARYDGLVAMLVTADTDTLVESYRRFYPLLQEAYVNLGYPDQYFNDRLIEVIDHLLASPEPQGPIQLERPHVLFQFADPDLEALSVGQKLMIRIGNDHAKGVRASLAAFRDRIASSGG